MRRILVILLFSLPLLVLAGWLFSRQAPVLLGPQWWWLSASGTSGAPAACEAAASLQRYGGQRVLFQQPAIASQDALARAQAAIADHYQLADGAPVTILETGGPSLFSAVFAGERRLVWLVSARIATSQIADLPGTDMPGAAALVYVDAATGEPLALLSAVGAGQAAVMCPFPLRDWAVATVRSTPFLLLAGYAGLLVVLGLGIGLRGLWRKRHPNTAGRGIMDVQTPNPMS